jgi:hypothetical protein
MNKLMKMAIGPFVAVALGASLVACTGEDPGDEPSAVDSTTPTDIETTSEASEDPVLVDESVCPEAEQVALLELTWQGDPCTYVKQALLAMTESVTYNPILWTEGSLEVRTVEADEEIACTNSILDDSNANVFTVVWCAEGYVAVASERLASDMESDESALFALNEIMMAYSDYLLPYNGYQWSNEDSACAAGYVMWALVNQGELTEEQALTIVDGYFLEETLPHFEQGFRDTCSLTSVA